ncbi:MAG: FG-GAP repeat domain-containing protein [Actinomycetota bacterium]
MFCTRGAKRGTIRKTNRLWMQMPSGSFIDRAGAYGVEDPLGRGRHATFMDLNGDPYPDLFIGNEFPRPDGLPSPNRTYLNVEGQSFRQVKIGATRERGAECVQAVDYDGDGWQDLIVCGQQRLLLYRNGRGGKDGRRLRNIAPRLGIDLPHVSSVLVEDLDGDGHSDLVVLKARRLMVFPGMPGGSFDAPKLLAPLTAGHWVTWGDLDGRRGPDLFVVQACARGAGGLNIRDLALLDLGPGWTYSSLSMPPAEGGCGDIAATIDVDHDGLDEVIVLNGVRGPWGGIAGPVQVLTTGAFP